MKDMDPSNSFWEHRRRMLKPLQDVTSLSLHTSKTQQPLDFGCVLVMQAPLDLKRRSESLKIKNEHSRDQGGLLLNFQKESLYSPTLLKSKKQIRGKKTRMCWSCLCLSLPCITKFYLRLKSNGLRLNPEKETQHNVLLNTCLQCM